MPDTEARIADLKAELSQAKERVAAAESKPGIASYSFSTQKETGAFRKKIREASPKVILHGEDVLSWDGKGSYLEDIQVPEFIRKALETALATGQAMIGAPLVPRLK